MIIDDARSILEAVGMPKQQTNEMCCRVLLSLANVSDEKLWHQATDNYMRIHDIITFISSKFDFQYAENSRETIRKQALKPFLTAAIIETNGKVTNSPNFSYRLNTEFLELIKLFGSELWVEELDIYLANHKTLIELYNKRKAVKRIDVMINGQLASLSLGIHNRLQKKILDEFASRFAINSTVLYVGDTQNKYLYRNDEGLKNSGIDFVDSAKLPDIVLHDPDKNWIYFIEAVTSVGPMSPQRVLELRGISESTSCGLIYVTAFMHFSTYKKFANEISWDTEVWIAEMPDHMIHLNGDKFLGPRD